MRPGARSPLFAHAAIRLLAIAFLIPAIGRAGASSDESPGVAAADSSGAGVAQATPPGQMKKARKEPLPCSSPGARQFDFWLGDWDATWEGGRGTNRVEKILDGCVIHENFDGGGPGGNGLVGKSYSTYTPAMKKWRQTWVDNQGGYLDFVGGMEGKTMILSRAAERDGKKFLQRMVWYNIGRDAFDWNWERSDDGGRTWTTQWAIHYVRMR